MTKQDLIGGCLTDTAAITLTLMPCIVGVWGITIVIDRMRGGK